MVSHGVEIYGIFQPAIFSRLDIIEIGKFRNMRFSDLDMSRDDISSLLSQKSTRKVALYEVED